MLFASNVFVCDWVMFVCFPNAMKLAWHPAQSRVFIAPTKYSICLRFHIRMCCCFGKKTIRCIAISLQYLPFDASNVHVYYTNVSHSELFSRYFFLRCQIKCKQSNFQQRGQRSMNEMYLDGWCFGIVMINGTRIERNHIVYSMIFKWSLRKVVVNRPFYWKLGQ